MDTDQLTTFVRGLASKPESWRHLVEHDRAARTYSELLRDDNVAAWLICWMDDHDTGFHDHDRSAGAVAVAQGEVIEDRLLLGRPPASRRYGAGRAFSCPWSRITLSSRARSRRWFPSASRNDTIGSRKATPASARPKRTIKPSMRAASRAGAS